MTFPPTVKTTFLILGFVFLQSCANSSPSSNGYAPTKKSTHAAKPTKTKTLPPDKFGMRTYTKASTYRKVRTTAYSCEENEPGAWGKLTSLGTYLRYGNQVRTAAADWSRYPAGTQFKIVGLPYTYIVEDYGRALVGTNTIDLYHPTISLMNKWGTRFVTIQVIKWGDPKLSIQRLEKRAKKYPHCKRMYDDLKKGKYL